ncbi:MAG TPA: response regulator transcription factor [Candidatus Polarisedimenticolia bacterium]|jgi:DNA-binding NarL/FixJ family response regulator|nr:response regulator transcription factor [Candidatus Polarisedimenticolia bacterium]
MKTVRILVADDHEIVRRGVKALLEARSGWEVCDEAVDGREAVEKTVRSRPDVVILDIGMPGLNGLEAARRIRKEAPASQILILTMHDSEQVVQEVLAAGARGYVLKSDAGRDLVQAVEALSNHKTFFTPSVTEMVLQTYLGGGTGAVEPGESALLTPREREVIQLLAEGRSNKEVADLLRISVRTAETHRTNIMRKLDCHSLSDLTRYAIRNNIINP